MLAAHIKPQKSSKVQEHDARLVLIPIKPSKPLDPFHFVFWGGHMILEQVSVSKRWM
jgi:hypothetical protein